MEISKKKKKDSLANMKFLCHTN